MFDRSSIRDETFGILTDDGLALEATLVKSAGLTDPEVGIVQVWVPKFPLTRSSVLPAARREAMTQPEGSRTVNLVFDLRGSGESDGVPTLEGFEIDIHSVHEWAQARFGASVTCRILGFPDMGAADGLLTLPLRPGVLAELYRYDPPERRKAIVLYFSHYANFGRDDDALCRAVADGGYTVYGGDLMRYLLLAAPLTLEAMAEDATSLAERLGKPIYLIGRTLAAGPALMMAILAPAIAGVLVTGPAQEGLASAQLFSQDNPAHFMLARQIKRLAPRPVIFLWNRAEAGEMSPEGLRVIHDLAEQPRLWAVVSEIDANVLSNSLDWISRQT